MRSRLRADRGSVTAEFAMLIPAMVLILVTFLGALNLQLQRMHLVFLATDAARSAGRGEAIDPQTGQGVELVTFGRGELICARAIKSSTTFKVKLEETVCARSNGR